MGDLTITATISRTDLALADLALEDPGTYRIVELSTGTVTWRRETVESPNVRGRGLIGAVQDTKTGRIVIRASASSAAALATRTATLTDAFEQLGYTLTVTIDGVTHSWACECADWAPGTDGAVDKFELADRQRTLAFTWPHDPVPLAGPL